MTRSRVLIIGGGVAGLAAALRLGQSGGVEPLVLEREREPGGLARSLHFKGVSTDLGPHRLHTELPEIERLVSAIAAPSLYTVKRKSRIFLRGKFLDYPPSPLATALHLGPVRCAHFAASMGLAMVQPAPAEESYESLMRRAFGPALYEFMLRPYSEKVWKTDPARIHADTARVRVSAGSLAKMVGRLFRKEKPGGETALREFRYVRGGVQTLVRHLVEHTEAAGAKVEVAKPVRQIELQPDTAGGWRATAVRCGEAENQKRIDFDSVVSTVPLPVLLNNLLPQIAPLADAREAASGLTYLDMIFVCVIVKRKVISGDNWLYFPESKWVFNRAYESKSFDPGMGPEDKSVLCVEMTCRPGDAIQREGDSEIAGKVIAQLEETGLFRADEVEESLVYRLPFGYPLYSLDYHERLERTLRGLRAIPNLLSTGRQGLFNHNNTDHSMLMGLRAAAALIAHGPRAAGAWYDTVEEFKHFRIVD